MTDLTALIERVKAAIGPDRLLDRVIYEALRPFVTIDQHQGLYTSDPSSYWFWIAEKPYTDSIDAALSLVERKLPGWAWASIKEDARGCIGYVHNNESAFVGISAQRNPARQWFECRAATPPLAILAALLTALQAQEVSP